ncbi:unnamed protein product, partial [Medioppia subpectinata]
MVDFSMSAAALDSTSSGDVLADIMPWVVIFLASVIYKTLIVKLNFNHTKHYTYCTDECIVCVFTALPMHYISHAEPHADYVRDIIIGTQQTCHSNASYSTPDGQHLPPLLPLLRHLRRQHIPSLSLTADPNTHIMNGLRESDYVDALKTYQRSRLEHMRSEATNMRLYLDTLRAKVAALETQRTRRRRLSVGDDIGGDLVVTCRQLRTDNLQLHIDCHCMTIEVDLYASGRMPLGVTDESFFRHLHVLR